MSPQINSPINTNDQSLDRVLKTGLPIALIFHNGDLNPGQEKELNAFAEKYQGKLLVARITARDNPKAANTYSITSTPSIISIRDQRILTRAQEFDENLLSAHVQYLMGIGPEPSSSPVENTSRHHSGVNGGEQQSPNIETKSESGHPISVTDSDFQRVVFQNSRPVLVDFWAPWCGPCRMTDPILTKLARENKGRIVIAKLNVDENPLTANKFGIHSIPTMMIVKGGKITDQWSGALPEASLRQRLSHALTA